MATKPISQREALRLRKRVYELEQEKISMFNKYRQEYPGGVFARRFTCGDASRAALDMAQDLGCVLIGKMSGGSLDIYAIPEGS